MGKRSSGFQPRPMDFYVTPHKAVLPLLPHLDADGINTFAEPCCGAGDLVQHLQCYNYQCVYYGDINTGLDALKSQPYYYIGADAIITNPPWTLALLLPLMRHLISMEKPVWLLMSADWPHLVATAGLVPLCSRIVPIGRVKWMAGSKHAAKDNAAWYRFHADHSGGPVFVPRQAEVPA